jgi:hypothetical protein
MYSTVNICMKYKYIEIVNNTVGILCYELNVASSFGLASTSVDISEK